MKRLVLVLMVFAAVPVLAQTPSSPSAPGAPAAVSGSITSAIQQLDNDTNSSKLTEYRDLRDQFYVPRLTFSFEDRASGWFFDFRGVNVSRQDQVLLAEGGRPGVWGLDVRWWEVPHNYSNKAVTPYIRRGAGLFEVPATVPITFKKLATGAADTPGVLASDELVRLYQATFLAPTPLATQTSVGDVAFSWTGHDAIDIGISYGRREKTGLKSTFGPIGDRPPRTLNIQLPEPVDYRTNEVRVAAEHDGPGYQVRGEYLLSDFANRIDTLQWQNVYTTAAPGASYDVWDRAVAVYGRRPLPPDNRYHEGSANVGVDLPLDSRLAGSVTYGRLEQNEPLLPYAYHVEALANQTLPRSTAEALVKTLALTADYVVAPAPRVHVRAFARRYDLDNETPSSRWQYVTQDTSNLNGTVAYVNKRVSLPYAWDRQNLGAEVTFRLPSRSTLVVGYEREAIGREFREADTDEDIWRATLRVRPVRNVTLQGRYIYGRRDGGEYNAGVTHEGYWYAPSEATDQNNPAVTFDNHPDMRRYDVSDRRRRQAELRASFSPRETISASLFVRYRKDDFDSSVTPSQPLLGTGLPEETAISPGDQLGWLENSRLRYGADVFVQPVERVTLNAFLNYDKGSAFERSLEFNENNKQNPGAIATAELGPWTRRSSQWTADIDDRTWSGGLGATFDLLPNRVTLAANYTLSLADVDIAYAGFGATNWDGTPFPPNHQFAFTSPPTIQEDWKVLDVRLEIPVRTVTVLVGYAYESYALDDWQQGSGHPWVESVGADTLLRDTSRSFQWGNRLFNFGTYLAPSYRAHLGYVAFAYRF